MLRLLDLEAYRMEYKDTVYKELLIDDKKSIRICTSERVSDKSVLVDIRQFRLYHDASSRIDDFQKRPTNKGIKFRPAHIPDVIIALAEIAASQSSRTIDEVLGEILASVKNPPNAE